MRYRIFVLTLMITLALSACNLGRPGDDPTDIPIATIDPGGQPTVSIVSPRDGDEVVVNDPVLVNVNVADAVGVTSVRLYANDQVVRTIASEAPTGDTSRSVLLDYTPRTAGPVNLRVVAYRNRVESDPAEISITVRNTQAQVTATVQQGGGVPIIDPNDPTCRALVNTGLNFRRGPGTGFEVIRVLGAGEILPIIGRLGDNTWWQLRSTTTIGWVDARFVTIYGNCTGIPAVAPPTTATPTVLPTATPTGIPPTPTLTFTPAPTATPVLPDLTITNISGPANVTIPSGQSSVTQTYSVNITNQGGPITRQFSNTVRVLPGGSTFDVGVVANLAANQSISLNVDITFTSAGTYILQFQADSNNEIAESNEVNNSGTFNVVVTSG